MGNNFETEIPGANGKSVGVVGFDMECDGTRDYVKKMFQPSKIDQVINFYGIPFIYKNEYKRFLKYRIQDRHCGIVNDHFLGVLRSEGYDVSDFDYLTLQHEYCARVPDPEQTGLDLHINYNEFLERDKAHRDSIEKQVDSIKDEQIASMKGMMEQMMIQMQELQKQVGQPNVLLSKEITNDGQQSSGSDSTRNAEGEPDGQSTNSTTTNGAEPITSNEGNPTNTNEVIAPQEDGEARQTTIEAPGQDIELGGSQGIQQPSNGTQSIEGNGSGKIIESDGFGTNPAPFKIGGETGNENTTGTEQPKKDRRNG